MTERNYDKGWDWNVERISNYTNNGKNTKYIEWLKSRDMGDCFFDPMTWLNAYNIYKKINFSNDDHIEVFSGKEGTGKSTLAIQKCCAVDKSFHRKRIFNSPNDLFRWLKDNLNRTKGKAIEIDEGNLFLFSREGLKKENIDVIKLFTLMRQANLYVAICIPYFKSIDSYIRMHRIDALTQIRVKHKSFTFYNEKGVKILSDWMRRGMDISAIKVPEEMLYHGSWSSYLPQINDINNENYKELKGNAWIDFLDKTIESSDAYTSELIPLSHAVKLVPMCRETMVSHIKKGTFRGKKIGKLYYINREDLLGMSG